MSLLFKSIVIYPVFQGYYSWIHQGHELKKRSKNRLFPLYRSRSKESPLSVGRFRAQKTQKSILQLYSIEL